MSAAEKIISFLIEAFLLIPPGFLAGIAVGMCAIVAWEWRKRRSAVLPQEENFNPSAIYVGEMSLSTSKLDAELFIEIAARLFNGTRGELHVYGARGTIKTDKTQENPDPEIVLPTPTMEDRFIATVQPLTETIVAIEQRIPRQLADKMLGLKQNESVSLNFQSLNILVGPQGDAAKAIRLPVWGGMKIWRDPARLSYGRIAYATASARLRPDVQIG